jgi:hypothetical protein
MPSQMLDTFSAGYSLANQLFPLKRPEKTRRIPVNLPPNSSFVAGLVVGQSTVSASDVQTITIGGAPTGGTFPITANGQTVTVPYNATTSAVQALLAPIYGSTNVVVAGTAGTSYVLTFGGALANQPIALVGVATTGLTGGTPTAAVAHTTQGQTDGTYAAYSSGGSNGLNVARGFLEMACSTDGNGNIYYNSSAAQSFYGISYPTTSIFTGGIFDVTKLVGLDANAVTNLSAHLESGTVTGPGVIAVD